MTAIVEAEGYNDLNLTAELMIEKAELTIKADNIAMIKDNEVPELTYAVEGTLYGDDAISGELYTKADGSKVGKYDITKGTLTAGDNYVVSFVKGTLTVGHKLEQYITIGELEQKTYGDEPFEILIEIDEKSGLDNFTFTSSNASVAQVSEDGVITIKGAGETKISVTEPGDSTYAEFEETLTLIVKKAVLKIKANDVTVFKGNKIPKLTDAVEGTLYGDDVISGELSTKANGNKVGKFDITKGTLKVSNNYKLEFEKGLLEVVEKYKQNIAVSEIEDKTYGDESFAVTVEADEKSKLTNFTFESSNEDVAEISPEGVVTIKNAGRTEIVVKQEGNEKYAPFESKQTLKVAKRDITVTADRITKKVGNEDSALTYTYVGELVGDDAFTGALKRKSGEKVGKYDITSGSLAINSNYNIIFKKALFVIIEKTAQNITVSKVENKTYGDEGFTVTVASDEKSKLTSFTFKSGNTKVAEISSAGVVTIKNAGKTEIIVKQAGDSEYAPFELKQTLVVQKKTVSVESINVLEKTAVLAGFEEADTGITIDFDELKVEIADKPKTEEIEVVVKNISLKGEGAENYAIATESVATTVAAEGVAIIEVEAENGTVKGAGVYLKGSKVTLKANPATKYNFDGWYNGKKAVSKKATYEFTADKNLKLTAKFSKKSSGGGGGGGGGAVATTSLYKVIFELNNGKNNIEVNVNKNALVTAPEAPVKDGYVFKGWFADKALSVAYDFNTKVTGNITIYAAWGADNSANEIILTIDSKEAIVFGEKKTNDVAPMLRNDRTMLPARFVAESLGAKVEWDNEKRQVIIKKEDVEIIIAIDSDIAYVNKKEVKLDSMAFIENERTYTPVRFVAESLGAKVEWNNEKRQVIITK